MCILCKVLVEKKNVERDTKTAAEMTVDEFTAWLKQRHAEALVIPERIEGGMKRRQRLPKVSKAPLVAMHTRRAMQRRRGK